MVNGRQIATIGFVIALALAAAACGRMAPLDTPYAAGVEARKQAIEDGADTIPPAPTPPVRDRKFFLDPLI